MAAKYTFMVEKAFPLSINPERNTAGPPPNTETEKCDLIREGIQVESEIFRTLHSALQPVDIETQIPEVIYYCSVISKWEHIRETSMYENILMPQFRNGDSAASTHLLNTLGANDSPNGTALYL